MVGASHASRTTDALAASGETVIKLTQPGWRITRLKVADMASKLSQILQKDGADCTVVFEMMDSNFFLAKTEEGGMVPICRRGSGEYHVDEDLVFAPKELQYRRQKDNLCLSISRDIWCLAAARTRTNLATGTALISDVASSRP